MSDWKTIEKGYLGSLLVEQKFIENGYNLFKPVLENGKVDLIAEKDNKYIKLQIKTIQIESNGRRIIPVRKISHNMGEYKVKLYTEKDIDYFMEPSDPSFIKNKGINSATGDYGIYFSGDKNIAKQYLKGYKKPDRQLYETYINIENPYKTNSFFGLDIKQKFNKEYFNSCLSLQGTRRMLSSDKCPSVSTLFIRIWTMPLDKFSPEAKPDWMSESMLSRGTTKLFIPTSPAVPAYPPVFRAPAFPCAPE